MLSGPTIARPGAKPSRQRGSPSATPMPGAAKVRDASGVDPVDGPEEVHLADVDAAVPEHGVDHCEMEIDVRDRHLQQVIRTDQHRAWRRKERLIRRSAAPAYCGSVTLSANATVLRMRARSSSIVCSASSCLGGFCPESQAAPALA